MRFSAIGRADRHFSQDRDESEKYTRFVHNAIPNLDFLPFFDDWPPPSFVPVEGQTVCTLGQSQFGHACIAEACL